MWILTPTAHICIVTLLLVTITVFTGYTAFHNDDHHHHEDSAVLQGACNSIGWPNGGSRNPGSEQYYDRREAFASDGGVVYTSRTINFLTPVTHQIVLAPYAGTLSLDSRISAPLLTDRYNLGLAVANNSLYAVGGITASKSIVGNAEVFGPLPLDAGAQSTSIASMSTARAYLGTAALGGLVYAVGGVGDSCATLKSAEAYNTATNTWQAVADMSDARHSFGLAAMNGKLYAAGGCGDTTCTVALRTVEVFTPGQTWQAVAPMAAKRTFLGLVAANSHLYAAAGTVFNPDNAQDLPNAEAYHENTNSWTNLTTMHHQYASVALTAYNNKVYAHSLRANVANDRVYTEVLTTD